MFSKWLITGDTHGIFSRFHSLKKDPETAIIILGDVGFNYTLDEHDTQTKKAFCKRFPFTVYCVKGNHEARPASVEGMTLVYDENVDGEVWMEPEFPQIRYFKEWGVYEIGGLRTLVIGGAYSVDKWYRLRNGLHWFDNEQLTAREMNECYRAVHGKQFDLVLSHTCPYDWMPTDLFLNFIDQSTVDNTMEKWLLTLRDAIDWNIWLYGHFHADRDERPCVQLCYLKIQDLGEIYANWQAYLDYGAIDPWRDRGPNFYIDMPTERE